MKSIYHKELGLAGLEDPITGIRVFTLCMEPGEKKSAIMAYTGAKYSRSEESAEQIISGVITKLGGVGAGERISTIVNSYGHASVADMSHVMIFVEQIPMVTAMRFFYLNPVQDGQERSTRFQNFSEPNFYIPLDFKNNEAKEWYERILHKQVRDYNELKDITGETLRNAYEVDDKNQNALSARTFDTLRHLLPMGMRTNFCAVMSARNWAKYIGTMRGSNQKVENVVGDMLYELLTGNEKLSQMGYVPEADTLIRYAEKNTTAQDTVEELLSLLKEEMDQDKFMYEEFEQQALKQQNVIESFFEHLALLATGKSYHEKNFFKKGRMELVLQKAGEIIFANHNDKKQLGNIFQSGTLQFSGSLDIGALKDFNRQRSLERFILFLENSVSPKIILYSEPSLCEYLYTNKTEGMIKLAADYTFRLKETYEEIRELQKEYALPLEHVRYLVPHAHKSQYRIYGSLDDILYVQNLRIRPGGHINYRMETYRWYEQMCKSTIPGLGDFWKQMKLTAPNPQSSLEFVDRG